MEPITKAELLESEQLTHLLSACPSAEITELGRFVYARAEKTWSITGGEELAKAFKAGHSGHELISAIRKDLAYMSSRAPFSPSRPYAEWIKGVARRHGLLPEHRTADTERKLLKLYDIRELLDGLPSAFADRGKTSLSEKGVWAFPAVGFFAYVSSPNWGVLTAATLKIGIMRQINLVRLARATLECLHD